MNSLQELLGASDFVSINCPLTDSTRGLVNHDFIASMKPGLRSSIQLVAVYFLMILSSTYFITFSPVIYGPLQPMSSLLSHPPIVLLYLMNL